MNSVTILLRIYLKRYFKRLISVRNTHKAKNNSKKEIYKYKRVPLQKKFVDVSLHEVLKSWGQHPFN